MPAVTSSTLNLRIWVCLGLAAGCGGSGDDPPLLRYVEGGEAKAGAAVVVSTLLGETVLETETDADGNISLELSEPSLVTIGRNPAATWLNIDPYALEVRAEVFSLMVSPGQSLTVGSTVPPIDASMAGRIFPVFQEDAPGAEWHEIQTGLGFMEIADAIGGGIPVPAGAVEAGTMTLLAWGMNSEPQKTAYVAVDVDLAALRDGPSEIEVDMPPWRTDFEEIPISISGLSDPWVSADTSLWRDGKRYVLGTDYGHTPGSPVPETVNLSVRIPCEFADQIDVAAFNSADGTPHWLSAAERIPGPPAPVDFDIAGTAPSGCYAIDVQSVDAGLVKVAWDGGGGSEDAIVVQLRNATLDASVPTWRLVLPPGTAEVVLPTLPAALASSQINPNASVEAFVHLSDLSQANDYDSFIDAVTAGGFDSAEIGDTQREGVCGGQLN
jgi:hypothetical protein